METSNSWRDHDGLAHEAAIVARAKRWLPEFLRGAPPVEFKVTHRSFDEMREPE